MSSSALRVPPPNPPSSVVHQCAAQSVEQSVIQHYRRHEMDQVGGGDETRYGDWVSLYGCATGHTAKSGGAVTT